MKILYLEGYKWLLPQDQRVRISFLGYTRYEVLAKHIKPFFKKTIKVKERQCLDYYSSTYYQSNAERAETTKFQTKKFFKRILKFLF